MFRGVESDQSGQGVVMHKYLEFPLSDIVVVTHVFDNKVELKALSTTSPSP